MKQTLLRLWPLVVAALFMAMPVSAANEPLFKIVDASGNVLALTAGGAITTAPGSATATFVDCSGTITLGGTAQNAVAAATATKYLFILNPASATETLWISVTGTAAASGEATGSMALSPSQSYLWTTDIPTTALSVVGATTAHKFTCTRV